MTSLTVHLDLIFHSLSDSTRRDILRRLTRNELNVSEIAAPYSISMAAVSKHLRVLGNANLIKRKREGKWHILKANMDPLKEVDNWIEFYRQFWEDSFDKMDEYLTELQNQQERGEEENE